MNHTDTLYLSYSGENVRDRLQNLFDNSFKRGDAEQVREHYRTLRRLEMECEKSPSCGSVDISCLTENITAACDIIAADTEKTFVFCGNETCPVYGSARLISKALLNLLSNAYLYGRERLVITKTVETADFVKIEVHSGGAFDFYKSESGRGLSFVREVCRSHGGNFFTESDGFTSVCIMIFPKLKKELPSAPNPDFFELVRDRLSPVYVEFFGMEYH